MCASVHATIATNAQALAALKHPLNVVVAGGTAGIGRAIALAFGKHCPTASITIIGRNETAANEIVSQLGSSSKCIRADLSLLSEVRNVAKKINAVDFLILSQGMLTLAGRTPTTENIDVRMALMYYGRVLFVQELLPLLRSSPIGGKVLFVLNSVRGDVSKIRWDDLSMERNFSLFAGINNCFSFTDLAVLHFAKQPENENVAFIHAFPGFVRTSIGDNLPFFIRIPSKILAALGRGMTPADCAEFMIHGMLNTEKGGNYINESGETIQKKKLGDDEAVNKVWEHTSQIISP